MKKTLTLLVAVVLASMCAISAQNLKDVLGGLAGAATSKTNAESSSSGTLGTIGSLIRNAVAGNGFTVDDLVGTWNYTSPAVSFDSENALKKIGGAAAATAVEDKLAPYYRTLQLDKTMLTVDADHNFTMKLGVAQLKGTVSKTEDGALVFAFNAFGKIKLGQVTAHATKAGDTLNLTFDATRLIQILTKVAGVLNNSTLKALTSLVNSYDGIYIGFKLKS